jgi:hypothetical protein
MTKYKIPVKGKILLILAVIPAVLVLANDVLAADPVNALIEDVPGISFLRDISIAGLFGLFLVAYYQERKSQHKKDEIITNKLLTTLEANSAAMTKVADAIVSFPKECAKIQESFRNEVERMRENNDG